MNAVGVASASGVGPAISPIEGEMNRIDNRISQIGDRIMFLRQSLDGVMRSEPNKAQAPSTAPREVEQSAMHGRLRGYADRLEDISSALEELASRITL